jgi:K+-transporting ATPase ATPase A chain
MLTLTLLQYAFYFAVLLLLAVPLGYYIARVFEGEATLAQRVFGPLERGLYRLGGLDPHEQMSWRRYAGALLLFNLVGGLLVYALQRLQGLLPLNPQALPGVSPLIALNTAVSFVTNTNWQAYAGETTMSHLTQMAALTVQNFLSAATGMAVAVALARGFSRHNSAGLGSFWVDLTRGTLYVLLPLSVLLATLLVSQGVVQTFEGSVTVTTLEPQPAPPGAPPGDQKIALGPVASQVAIKQLGTNGGGFYNANSAHPLENPNALSNILQLLAILLVPAALCFTFGALVRFRRQGWMLFWTMTALVLPALLVCVAAEQTPKPPAERSGAGPAFGEPGG